MSDLKQPRYLSVAAGALQAGAIHTGRAYKIAAHAQFANPQGVLYVLEDAGRTEDHESLSTVVGPFAYPLTLLEQRTMGRGATAEGAIVLRDLGPSEGHRWVTHWRNDQVGGFCYGHYFGEFAKALADYQERAAEALARDLRLLTPELAGA